VPVFSSIGTFWVSRTWDGSYPPKITSLELKDLNGKSSNFSTPNDSEVCWSLPAISPDGKLLVVADDENSNYDKESESRICVWELATGKLLHIFNGHTAGISALAFMPDGKTLISASYDRTVRLWSLVNGKNTLTLQAALPEIYRLFAVAVSPDGKKIAAAGGGDLDKQEFNIKVWDLSKGNREITLKGHKDIVTNLIFSRDGQTLLSGDEQGILKVWDSQNWQLRNSLDTLIPINSLDFNQDGSRVVTAHQDGSVSVWEYNSLKLVSVTEAEKASKDWIRLETKAYYNRADNTIFTTSSHDDTNIRQWE
jgi:WD40 repeat protein